MNGDELVARARYVVNVYQLYDDDVATLPSLECILSSISSRLPLGKTLTLVVEGGRKLDVIVLTERTVQATGNLYS